MNRERSNRAVEVECVVCHVRIVGVVDAEGTVRASNYSRPAHNAPAVPGYCPQHAGLVKP